MISIVDYGLGNVRAFVNMYKRMGIEATTASDAKALADATKIILPGVGAFDHAMTLLDGSGMRETLDEQVLGKRVPVLGVCVGMQILTNSSDEGTKPGLGWIPGHVRHFSNLPSAAKLPLPHMGWNDVRPVSGSPLLAGLHNDARFYFLHSLFFVCDNADHAAATANYGEDFVCGVHAGNIFGVQFHPEKSHHWGARLLKSFAEL